MFNRICDWLLEACEDESIIIWFANVLILALIIILGRA